ncbi:MAG: sterol desaturase family protein [Gemmatimonadaceae bacterium]
MSEWLHTAARTLELAIGWIFSPSWIPPKDFSFFRWLVVPGYGYGAVLIAIGLLELVMPQTKRPWNRKSLLSGTYLILAAKMGFYVVVVTPLIRNAWVYLGLPSLHLDQSLPLPLYMPLALLVVTFTAYWSHRLMHRLPIFWNIHKIHHSVQNLNVTSSFHMHFLELFIHTPLHLFTLLLLGTDLVAPFGLIFMVIDFLAHANVRLNMGKLTYIVCTPQAHRIHHSSDARHFDTNFGNTFMLWDHLFGTFHYDPANLPTSYGVDDHVPDSFVKQQVLPLVWIAKGTKGGFSKFVSRFRSQA